MSQRQYVNTRVGAKKRKADMYPSYEKIREAKRQCYPDPLLVLTTVSETKVKVPLQRLLDHTAERIFKVLESKNKSIESGDFNMIATGGGEDGTSDQARYGQSFASQPSTTDGWSETRYVRNK